MSRSKMKEDFRKMVKWSIRKMFENSPGGAISIHELKAQLVYAWEELEEEGFLNKKGDEE